MNRICCFLRDRCYMNNEDYINWKYEYYVHNIYRKQPVADISYSKNYFILYLTYSNMFKCETCYKNSEKRFNFFLYWKKRI